MKNTFSYNKIFIPEFFSTVLISLCVSLVTGFWFSNEIIHSQSIHKILSIVFYTLILLFVVALSFYFRRKYSNFNIDNRGIEKPTSWYSLPFIGFDQITRVEEGYGDFFGKESRFLRLDLNNGEIIYIYDYIYNYNQLRDIIEKHKGAISQSPFLIRGHFVNFGKENYKNLPQKLAVQSARRDKVFGNPVKTSQFIMDFIRRIICLLPVCFADFYLKILIDSVFKDETIATASALSYYSSTFSLIVSIMVARYIYFNLFSYEKSLVTKDILS